MNTTAIKVENISKCYRIGIKEEMHDTFAKSIFSFLKSPLKNYRKYRSLYNFDNINPSQDNKPSDIIWALREVSFEVKEGEVLGIIGVNGAGKSTLLKILSRITNPTGGYAKIRGRVTSLLEVGTGFHPELTGRENVYLNGTILGMKKSEIDQNFDEIVDFSGVENFIDTPVKRYSSGMQVRLAFAVAAHLEPEILIIDEVLAVGDARFQKKCINKMQDVGQRGHTVLFVSHNMPSVTRLCDRAILLDEGRLIEDGPSHKVVNSYLNSDGPSAQQVWSNPSDAPSGEVVRLVAVRVRTEDNQTPDFFDIRRPIGIDMKYEVLKSGFVLSPYFDFYNQESVHAFSTADTDANWRKHPRPIGHYVSTAWIPGNFLSEGTMFVGIGMSTMNPYISQFAIRDVLAFQVVDSEDGDSTRGDWTGFWGGAVRPLLQWNTQFYETKDKDAKVFKEEKCDETLSKKSSKVD